MGLDGSVPKTGSGQETHLGRFETIACVDVYVNVPSPGGESQANSPVTQSQVAYIRHFDIGGRELHLPQERFHLTKNFPARKTPPAKAAAPLR